MNQQIEKLLPGSAKSVDTEPSTMSRPLLILILKQLSAVEKNFMERFQLQSKDVNG